MSVEIRLSSAVTPIATELASELLRAAANAEPECHNLGHDDEAAKGDPVAFVALILSIPAAILATMDLVERVGVAERVRDLLKKVREVDGTATLHVESEPSLDLRTATEDEVMNLLAKSHLSPEAINDELRMGRCPR